MAVTIFKDWDIIKRKQTPLGLRVAKEEKKRREIAKKKTGTDNVSNSQYRKAF